MQLLQVGKIVNTHGLKGMVKVYPYTNLAQDFERFKTLYLGATDQAALVVSALKYHKNLVIVKFKGLDCIEDVEHLKNRLLYADKSQADQLLADDEYYIEDLIGLSVIDTAGKSLGVVCAFRDSGRQVVLEVEQRGSIWYLPFVDAFIERVDLAKKQLQVQLIEGIYSED